MPDLNNSEEYWVTLPDADSMSTRLAELDLPVTLQVPDSYAGKTLSPEDLLAGVLLGIYYQRSGNAVLLDNIEQIIAALVPEEAARQRVLDKWEELKAQFI